tara:strand:+ start:7329 stop:7982 length:654 start_codon:yes stop_codon:yes gene_type:complete
VDYFISDTHFGHKNVIRYCNRPFKTVSEMNETMISRWNETVTDADRVFVIGDVFLTDLNEATRIIKRLNGYKILVAGNHDRSKKTMLHAGFDEYHKRYEYEIDGIGKGLLLHYPMPDSIIEKLGYNFLIHGHIHRKPKFYGLKLNVAVDLIDFTPLSLDGVKKILRARRSESRLESFEASVDDGMLKVDMKIRVEDFSGAIDHIYNIMSDHWKEAEK